MKGKIYELIIFWDTDQPHEEVSELFFEENTAIEKANEYIRFFLKDYPDAKEINPESELPLCVDFETEYNYRSFRVMSRDIK